VLLVKLEALDWPLAKLFALLFEPELFAVPAPFMEFPLAVQLTTETVLELAVTPEEFETEPLEPTRFEFATVVIVLLLLLPPPGGTVVAATVAIVAAAGAARAAVSVAAIVSGQTSCRTTVCIIG